MTSGQYCASSPGKITPPGQVRGPAPELGIDEIGESGPAAAPAGVTMHSTSATDSHGRPCRPRIEHTGRDDAQKPAVKRHAALPDHQDLGRIGRGNGRVGRTGRSPAARPGSRPRMTQVSRSSTCPARHRGGPARPERGRRTGATHHAPADQDAGDIGQRVPAQRELHAEEADEKISGAMSGKGMPACMAASVPLRRAGSQACRAGAWRPI